jgi:hypothetical protein
MGKARGFLAGRPEDIVEQLKAVEKRYPGLDRVICATPLGTPLDVQLADLDRFTKEVIPPSATPGPPPRRNRPAAEPARVRRGGTSAPPQTRCRCSGERSVDNSRL